MLVVTTHVTAGRAYSPPNFSKNFPPFLILHHHVTKRNRTPMHLFLIRHGETVDNVAGLYAGWRDSALTAHGVLQARRLGSHLAATAPGPVTHIFSSDLQRAAKTADAVHAAVGFASPVVRLRDLREKNFGGAEGLKYGTSPSNSDAETADSMTARANRFLDEHILSAMSSGVTCIVVSHGLMLGSLFRALSTKLQGRVTTASEAQAVPAWSNTGYTEVTLSGIRPLTTPETPLLWGSVKMHVMCVNATTHLHGLRKTRGGIGSAAFDTKQRIVDSFFKNAKRKRDE